MTDFNPAIPFYDAGWFTNQLGTPYECTSTCDPIVSGGDDNSSEKAIAQDSTITSIYVEESKKIAQQYLYEKLYYDSVLLNSDSAYINFYTLNKLSSIGKFQDVKKNTKFISDFSALFIDSTIYYTNLIEIYADSILFVDSLAKVNPSNDYSSIRKDYVLVINYLKTNISNLVIDRNNDLTIKIDSAKYINNSISPSEIPEGNNKFINFIETLYLKYGEDTLITYYSDIYSLAMQCPYQGGTAVYRGRTFVSIFNDSIEYDDSNVCYGIVSPRKSLEEKIAKTSNIELIPNPANDLVNIVIKSALEGQCKISISNFLGEVVFTESFIFEKSKSHQILTSKFASGVYIVKIEINKTTEPILKLVITR